MCLTCLVPFSKGTAFLPLLCPITSSWGLWEKSYGIYGYGMRRVAPEMQGGPCFADPGRPEFPWTGLGDAGLTGLGTQQPLPTSTLSPSAVDGNLRRN